VDRELLSKCGDVVKKRFGEEYLELCSIGENDVEVYRKPVVGWLVTASKAREGGDIVDIYPMILSHDAGPDSRYVEVTCDLGYTPDKRDLESFIVKYKTSADERIVGVLPSWPGTYHVTGSVKGVGFVLGIEFGYKSDEELKHKLLEMYVEWLAHGYEEEIRKFLRSSKR
jgi:hypothetical protein